MKPAPTLPRTELETEVGQRKPRNVPAYDRSLAARLWYETVRTLASVALAAFGGLRVGGRGMVPGQGGMLLVSNHLSYLDVFVLGVAFPRPLNYVARSTLFVPVLGFLIRSVGGFPIQRDGMGASGLKETLRRLRNGGTVILFPEGTRTRDGRLSELKPGIAALSTKARVPVVPVALAGTFESWPRARLLPRPYPVRVEYGPPIFPAEIAGLSSEAITALIRDRLLACQQTALAGLDRDLGGPTNLSPTA